MTLAYSRSGRSHLEAGHPITLLTNGTAASTCEQEREAETRPPKVSNSVTKCVPERSQGHLWSAAGASAPLPGGESCSWTTEDLDALLTYYACWKSAALHFLVAFTRVSLGALKVAHIHRDRRSPSDDGSPRLIRESEQMVVKVAHGVKAAGKECRSVAFNPKGTLAVLPSHHRCNPRACPRSHPPSRRQRGCRCHRHHRYHPDCDSHRLMSPAVAAVTAGASGAGVAALAVAKSRIGFPGA